MSHLLLPLSTPDWTDSPTMFGVRNTTRPKRMPTISDIRVKTCWICLEEETAGGSNPAPDWCHPCKCSLICHSKCLLEWMKAQETNTTRASGPIKCPQCGTEYTIVSYQPPMLQIFDRINIRMILLSTGVLVGGILVGAVGSMVMCSCAYGSLATEAFYGPEAYQLLYGDDPTKWDAWTWFELTSVPWNLLTFTVQGKLSRNLITVMSIYPLRLGLQHANTSFPPSPLLSLLLFPCLVPLRNMVYNRLLLWVTDKAASQIADESLHRPVRRISNAAMPEMVVEILDAGANGNRNGNGNGDAQRRNIGPAGLNGMLRRANMSPHLIMPLFLPWIAKGMGNLLLRLSNYSSPLRKFLGVRKRQPPINRIVGNLLNPSPSWDRIDPVWWRNTLGLMVFHVALDGCGLWYTYLIERERQSRRVVSRSFEGIDIGSLDLIAESP